MNLIPLFWKKLTLFWCVLALLMMKEFFLKVQNGISISTFKMKVSNSLNFSVCKLTFVYKLEQQPNIIFELNTDKNVKYLLEVCHTYNCILVNVQARLNVTVLWCLGSSPKEARSKSFCSIILLFNFINNVRMLSTILLFVHRGLLQSNIWCFFSN